MEFKTINPATEEIIAVYRETDKEEVNAKIELSHSVFKNWRNVPYSERAGILLKVADLLEKEKDKAAEIMAIEMGKPLAQGIAEVEKSAWVCRHYAENAESMLKNKIIETEAAKSYVTFNPLGVIYAVMPWNYPFWQVFRFAAPNLMAGNTAVLKHAPNVPQCSMMIYDIFKRAGLPDGVFEHILISQRSVPSISEMIISDSRIAGVTLTGSSAAGASVAAIAGKNLKKSVLELGGSDPYIILADADLEQAVESCVIARMNNAGQTCIAAKRFLVDKKIEDDFITLFVERAKQYVPGNPLEKDTIMGPIARKDLQLTVHAQTLESIRNGAKPVLGGELPKGKGFYYPPTVLINVSPSSPSFKEEIFGPVASITAFENENEAIELANSTNFGLGAAVFSADIEKAEFIASEKLEAGFCAVNQFVKSDPRLPFGGIKNSGFGRELSEFGITEFLNIKTVVVK
jgi:succinate-semialdehyde dehydrogenase/glutarate-semialdehyde dehydrogenase